MGYLVNVLLPPGVGAVKGTGSGIQEGDGAVENAVPALCSPAEPCGRVDDEVIGAYYSCSGTKGKGAPPGVSFNA